MATSNRYAKLAVDEDDDILSDSSGGASPAPRSPSPLAASGGIELAPVVAPAAAVTTAPGPAPSTIGPTGVRIRTASATSAAGLGIDDDLGFSADGCDEVRVDVASPVQHPVPPPDGCAVFCCCAGSRSQRITVCVGWTCVALMLTVVALVSVALVSRAGDEQLFERVMLVFEDSNCTYSGNGTFFLDVPDAEARPLDLRTPEEELLGTLFCRLVNHSTPLMGDILRGAHMEVHNDGGWYYDVFTRLKGAYPRTSSHNSILQQYGVPEGSTLETLLTGQHRGRPAGQPSVTWFQLEGAAWDPFRHPATSVVHMLNYFQYIITGLNIGPLGDSKYTERNPLVIPYAPLPAKYVHMAPQPIPADTF